MWFLKYVLAKNQGEINYQTKSLKISKGTNLHPSSSLKIPWPFVKIHNHLVNCTLYERVSENHKSATWFLVQRSPSHQPILFQITHLVIYPTKATTKISPDQKSPVFDMILSKSHNDLLCCCKNDAKITICNLVLTKNLNYQTDSQYE